MKKIAAIAIAFLVIACNKGSEKEGNLHLTGNVEGLKQGKILVKQFKDTTLVTLDTIKFEGNSNFDTKVNLEEPQMLFLFLDRGETKSIDNHITFFAEPGEMTFNTTLKEFYASAKFTGSKNQKVYEDYLKIKAKLNNDNADLVVRELENIKKKSASEAEKIQSDKEKLTIRKYLYTANFAVVHGKNEVAPYIALTEIPDANLKLMDTIQKSMSPKVAKSKYGKRLTDWINERKQNEQE